MEKVLLVDDDTDNLDALERALRKEFQIFRAGNGFEAIHVLDREGEMALVLSELSMPVVDGVEFLMGMLHAFPDTVRVVLTRSLDPDLLLTAVNDLKLFRYMVKPFNREELSLVLHQGVDLYAISKGRRLNAPPVNVLQFSPPQLQREELTIEIDQTNRAAQVESILASTLFQELSRSRAAEYPLEFSLELDQTSAEEQIIAAETEEESVWASDPIEFIVESRPEESFWDNISVLPANDQDPIGFSLDLEFEETIKDDQDTGFLIDEFTKPYEQQPIEDHETKADDEDTVFLIEQFTKLPDEKPIEPEEVITTDRNSSFFFGELTKSNEQLPIEVQEDDRDTGFLVEQFTKIPEEKPIEVQEAKADIEQFTESPDQEPIGNDKANEIKNNEIPIEVAAKSDFSMQKIAPIIDLPEINLATETAKKAENPLESAEFRELQRQSNALIARIIRSWN